LDVQSYFSCGKKRFGRHKIRRKILLFRSFVIAGRTAGLAVHEAVVAKADVNHSLAEAAEFLTFAGALKLFALRAFVFSGTRSGAHATNVARPSSLRKMTLVIGLQKSSARLALQRFLRGL
jgi:hypothetical protein